MTAQVGWQIGSLAVLIAALSWAFAWYERARPPARVASAVAVLAAFAVIGRIAFAPFPNITPTTDIVIIAGFTLGAAPGLLTGVLAALVSNFYFGQGPWTPWQMFAWGLCGLIGALLGRIYAGLGRREPHRVVFALYCAAAAVAYGAILNFATAVILGGSDLYSSFLVFSARAVPFDAAHAIGNFTFYLIAGPVLIRMLRRLRTRAELHWPARPRALNST